MTILMRDVPRRRSQYSRRIALLIYTGFTLWLVAGGRGSRSLISTSPFFQKVLDFQGLRAIKRARGVGCEAIKEWVPSD